MLAVAGAVALVLRALRTLLRLGLWAAEATTAAGLAEVSARRGDLTGMAERQAAVRAARRQRRRSLLLALFWLAWLVIPVLAGWAREAYALAAPIWLLPASPIRSAPAGGRE